MNKSKSYFYIVFFVIISLITNSQLLAQTVIQMEYDRGVYKIPCYVNGARMKFILDTGASDVCLSMEMAEYLLENDYLTEDDFIGLGYSTVADGSVVDHLKLTIKDIEIGGLHIKNVPAIVIARQSVPLLMGQSALRKLGSYTINGNKLVINNYAQEGEGEKSKLLKTAKECMDKEYYALAISNYEQAQKISQLGYADMEHLAWCYKCENKYKECFEICKKWLSLYESLNIRNFNSSIYELTWRCNYYFGHYEQALIYKQKRMLTRSSDATLEMLAWDQEHLGDIYFYLTRYKDAITSFNASITNMRNFKQEKDEFPVIKDNNLLACSYFGLCRCYRMQGNKKDFKKFLELAKKCGHEQAIKISYNKDYIERYYNKGVI